MCGQLPGPLPPGSAAAGWTLGFQGCFLTKPGSFVASFSELPEWSWTCAPALLPASFRPAWAGRAFSLAACQEACSAWTPPLSWSLLARQLWKTGSLEKKSLALYKVVTNVGLYVVKPKCHFPPKALWRGTGSLSCQLRKFCPRNKEVGAGVCPIRKCELTDEEPREKKKTQAKEKKGSGRRQKVAP